jgi:hypothetical protein
LNETKLKLQGEETPNEIELKSEIRNWCMENGLGGSAALMESFAVGIAKVILKDAPANAAQRAMLAEIEKEA